MLSGNLPIILVIAGISGMVAILWGWSLRKLDVDPVIAISIILGICYLAATSAIGIYLGLFPALAVICPPLILVPITYKLPDLLKKLAEKRQAHKRSKIEAQAAIIELAEESGGIISAFSAFKRLHQRKYELTLEQVKEILESFPEVEKAGTWYIFPTARNIRRTY